MSTATQVQFRRGSAALHATFAGKVGEVTYDTDGKTLRCHDGGQVGGFVLLRKNADGTIPIGEYSVSADGKTITSSNAAANMQIRNGQLYMWDQAAYLADPAKPWRIFGCDAGRVVLSDPVA